MKTKISAFLMVFSIAFAGAQEKIWSLQECVDHALENNISIKKGELVIDLQKEDVAIAEGNFYPSLSASSSMNWNFGSFIDVSGGRVSTDSRSNSFGLSSGVTLFNGFRNKNMLNQSLRSLDMTQLDLEKQQDDISLNVVNFYLNVLFSKENIKIAKEQIGISKEQLKRMNELVDAGTEPRANLLEVAATLATDEERLINAENSLDLALLSLAQVLQISHRGFDVKEVDIEISSASLIYNDTDEIYNKSESVRPEIHRAKLAMENAETGVEIARSYYFPSLSFGGGLGTTYQHSQGKKDVRLIIDPNDPNNRIAVPNGFGKQLEDNLGYNFGFSLSIPIFNRLQTRSNVNKAIINQDIAAYNLEDERIRLRETIERAYADARAALKQYEASLLSQTAQEESFKNAQESYNLGVMTSFDFDQVRNRLVNAQSTLINAKYNFVFKTKLLEFYYGIPIVL